MIKRFVILREGLEIIKKPDKRIPFFNKIIEVVTAAVSFIEVKDDFLNASNLSLPVRYRIVSVVKGSCCTAALLTSYCATQTSTNPRLVVIFIICCIISASGYVLVGGDLKLALCFIYNSTSRKT